MRLAVFGLTASSTWGNGHATLWRGLARALAQQGHALAFYEKDQPWYASHRDATVLPGGELRIYRDLSEIQAAAHEAVDGADVALVTSYCPDALAATELVLGSKARLKVFYDLDTGITAAQLRAGEPVPWIGPRGLGDFDLVLSFTGGRALALLRDALGARRIAPLYGTVDPEIHRPSAPMAPFRGDCSYLGTWAASRQPGLERLFLGPAERMPERTFLLAGSMYDHSFPWRDNIRYVRHLEPALHPAFFCSSPLTVNVTRPEMAALGHCPPPRLFEAAACGVPVLSDWFDGLDTFFEPDSEILVAHSVEEAIEAIAAPREELAWVGRRARDRALAEHTAEARARQLVAFCEAAARGSGLERLGGAQEEPGDGARIDRDLERDLDWEYGPVHGSASERGPDDDRDYEHRWTIDHRGDGR